MPGRVAGRASGRYLPVVGRTPETAGPASQLTAGRSIPGTREIGGAATIIDSTIPVVYGNRRVTGLICWYDNTAPVYGYVFGRGGPYSSVASTRWERPLNTTITAVGYTGGLSQTPNFTGYNFPGHALAKVASQPTDSAMLSANINGRIITDFRDSSTSASRNPVLIAYDILTQLGQMPASKIDAADSSSSWWVAADWCDDTVDSIDRWSVDHILVQPDALAAAAEVLSYAHISMHNHKGLRVLAYEDIDPTASTTVSITAGDWIGTPRVVETPGSGLPNYIRVKYTASTTSLDGDEAVYAPAGVEPSGVIEEQVDMPSFTSSALAVRWAALRYDLAVNERLEITGQVGAAGDSLAPGNLVMVTLPVMKNRTTPYKHACRLLSIDPRLDGSWDVYLREYGSAIS